MLDSIIDGIKGQVVSTITEKTGLDAGQAEQTIPLAKESITEGITSAVSGGNVGGILDMVKSATGGGDQGGGLLQNMVYKGIAGNFISKVTSSLGIPESMASTVSSLALPTIMNKLGGATQAAGDTDEIDQGSLMSVMGLDAGSLLGKAGDMLGGGDKKGGGLGGMLGNMLK